MRERDVNPVYAYGPVEVVLGILEIRQKRHPVCGVHIITQGSDGR